MAPWDILFAIKESDPRARIQAFIDSYKLTNYEVRRCSILKPDGKNYICAFRNTGSEEWLTRLQGFDGHLMNVLQIVSAEVTKNPNSSTSTAKTTFSVLVTPKLQNPRGNMHGGAQALLIDMCTTLAVASLSTEDFWHFGV